MEFKQEYKEKVFETLQHNQYIDKIMSCMESGDSLSIRFYFEAILNELECNLKPRIIQDDGDRLLWNSIVSYWFRMNNIYSEFMDEYTYGISDDEQYQDSSVLKYRNDGSTEVQ